MKAPKKATKGTKSAPSTMNFTYDTNSLKTAKGKGKLKGFLNEETKQLDTFLQKFEEKGSNKPDEIDKEIENVLKDCKKTNKTNIDNLLG